MNKTIHQVVAEHITAMTKHPQFGTPAGLEAALRYLAKWRSVLIDNTVTGQVGTTIQDGPFKGMIFVKTSTEANVAPRILGIYEADLHPTIESIIRSSIKTIVDIGCADGYYACGFAYRMPHVQIRAHDINGQAQAACSALAKSNGLADRITVSGEFFGRDFEHLTTDTMVFIDAEGAEDGLLLPDIWPNLRHLTILVECHDVFSSGLSESIAERFVKTHSIQIITPGPHAAKLPSAFAKASHLDQLLASWEWRAGPTPWLFMRPLEGLNR